MALVDDPFDTTPQISGALGAVQIGIDESYGKAEEASKSLTEQLDFLMAAVADITNLPPITGATLPDLVNQVEAFQILGTTPVRPTDIDFVRPASPIITDAQANFPAQTAYASTLLTNVKAVLDDMIMGFRDLGVDPAALQQTWDAARERTTAVTQGAITNIQTIWARAGWGEMQGPEADDIYRAEELQAEQDIAESRSIAIAEADLKQKNLQFSIQQAATLEGVLVNMHIALQAQMVQAEKVRVETIAEVNKLNVEVFTSEIEADVAYAKGKVDIYNADADVFGKLIDAETSRIEAQVAVQTAEIAYGSKKADLAIEVAKANIATMMAQKELSIGTMKAIATLLSQLVAAYGSTVHYSAGITAGTTQHVGYSKTHNSSYPHAESPSTE